MLKRTGHGLRHLNGKCCDRIVGQAMVLAFLIGELGLKKKTGPRDEACAICGGQALSDCGFKVVLTLVGRIDGAKARADGEFSERGGTVFFPRSAVKEAGNGSGFGAWHQLYSYIWRRRAISNWQLAISWSDENPNTFTAD